MPAHTPTVSRRDSERRKTWSAPTLTTLEIHTAQGAVTGPLCDKHGSLSIGSVCP